ncbi:MAG: 3-deoxy-8-phosphooctulonate synthase [Elusimicrobia bacterium]|nr:3-deoxy-8-phosphooctulonate synthase [Elusimicrobiota bacterium]
MKKIRIADIDIGQGQPVFVAGPCVIEDRSMVEKTAGFLRGMRDSGRKIIMKLSYDKANRTSIDSFRGPGIKKGMDIISGIKKEYGLPVLVDVHCRADLELVAGTADCIQIPAFLCRQTDLLVEAGKTGRVVNIKKGQFMSPWAMSLQAEKVLKATGAQVILTERGTSFGYGDLVVDMRSLIIMRERGYPVLYDATHSQQSPPAGHGAGETSGKREFIIPLAKAARSVGADGIYCEIHPDPANAKSDRDTQLDFGEFENLVDEVSKM